MEEMFTSEILSTESKNHLSQAGKWAKIVGIVGIVFSCFMAFLSLFFVFGMHSLSGILDPLGTNEGLPGSGSLLLVGLLYLFLASIYFFMSLCAYRFGTYLKSGLQFNTPDGLANSFKNLKNYFTIHGVILIAVIAMSIIGILMVSILGFFMT